jgi:hypothetical protein
MKRREFITLLSRGYGCGFYLRGGSGDLAAVGRLSGRCRGLALAAPAESLSAYNA